MNPLKVLHLPLWVRRTPEALVAWSLCTGVEDADRRMGCPTCLPGCHSWPQSCCRFANRKLTFSIFLLQIVLIMQTNVGQACIFGLLHLFCLRHVNSKERERKRAQDKNSNPVWLPLCPCSYVEGEKGGQWDCCSFHQRSLLLNQPRSSAAP